VMWHFNESLARWALHLM